VRISSAAGEDGAERERRPTASQSLSGTLSSRAGGDKGLTAGSSATARLSTMSPPALALQAGAMFTVEPK
jgi:hypothetical protein